MATVDAAEVLAAQNVNLDLEDGDLVAAAVVIAKIVQSDGCVTVAVGSSEGLTWLDQIALVTVADGITKQGGYARAEDED